MFKAHSDKNRAQETVSIVGTPVHRVCALAGDFATYNTPGSLEWVRECLSGALLSEVIRWYLYCLLSQLPTNAPECLMRDEVAMAQGFALTYPQVHNHVSVLIDLRDFLEEHDPNNLPDLFQNLTEKYPSINAGVGKRLLRMRPDLTRNEKAILVRGFRKACKETERLMTSPSRGNLQRAGSHETRGSASPGPQPFEPVLDHTTPVKRRIQGFFRTPKSFFMSGRKKRGGSANTLSPP